MTPILMRELAECKPMTREEEQKLARRMRRGKPESRAKARDEFIRRNVRLVFKMAKNSSHIPSPFEARYAAGMQGMIIAVDRFEPKRGLRFSTFATWWINAVIRRDAYNTARMVRLPVRKAQKSPDEHLAYLDAPSHTAEDMAMHELVPDESLDSEGEAIANQRSAQARTLLSCLNAREREIIEYRFGFRTGEEETLAYIGCRLGLSRERIRQIEMGAKQKMMRRSRG